MDKLDIVYEQIDDIVNKLEMKFREINFSEIESMEDLNAYLYDSEYKKADYELVKYIVMNFDDETGIALLDLLRQKLSDAVLKIFGGRE